MASTIVESDGDHNFVILTGVGDSSSFHSKPTWESPESDKDKCYFGDYSKPAADVAAQVSAALAVIAKALREHSSDADNGAKVVAAFTEKAVHAFDYAVDVYMDHKRNATCSSSGAANHCIGKCYQDVSGV